MIRRGEVRWFRFASPRTVDRTYLGPVLAQLPEHHWPAIRAALLDVLGLASRHATLGIQSESPASVSHTSAKDLRPRTRMTSLVLRKVSATPMS